MGKRYNINMIMICKNEGRPLFLTIGNSQIKKVAFHMNNGHPEITVNYKLYRTLLALHLPVVYRKIFRLFISVCGRLRICLDYTNHFRTPTHPSHMSALPNP